MAEMMEMDASEMDVAPRPLRRVRKAAPAAPCSSVDCENQYHPDAKRQMTTSPASIMMDVVPMAPLAAPPSADEVLMDVSARTTRKKSWTAVLGGLW